jgi:hypothetical protein
MPFIWAKAPWFLSFFVPDINVGVNKCVFHVNHSIYAEEIRCYEILVALALKRSRLCISNLS